MPRTVKRPTAPAAPTWVQAELFPRPMVIEPLDPRAVGGERTRVEGVYVVREHVGAARHRVFHDRYGWYCEEHGARCPMVGALRRSLEPNAAG